MDLEMKSAKYFEDLLGQQDPMEYLCVGLDEDVIGWGIIKKYSDRSGYKLTGETSVYLDRDHRGKGYGKTIKTHLMHKCSSIGYKHLVAKIWADNEVSIGYNLKLGYTMVGIQQKVGYVNGRWIDVAILQYIFED